MKLLYIITAIILPTVLFSQNRTIVPLLGTIVFNSKEIITNEKLYAISLKEFKKGMMEGIEEEVILERLTSGIKTDSVQLKEAMEMAEENLSILFEIKNNMQYRHELKDNIINSIQSFNGEVLENNIIDTKTGMKDNIEYYSLNKVVDLREFKNERKKINGYDCFKITYSYREESISGLNDFLSGYINHRELWVTEKIKCAFHPVINDRLILEKYYPLEITEHSDAIKGCETKYSLVNINIKH
ncbi:hypothetical protein [uncultured Flavobacterium sp.]|uniref:hypothetical protein n=1 Tax=uncultured Flavobacterium sp. TaxID=165435 RepID=UPI0025E8D1C4|nr:hypothetical protein [uncultured Flavobacterium sp.]